MIATAPKTAPRGRRTLVLLGGGAKAIWQVGACEHLIGERGYWFDLIASFSAGAVNGAALAQAHNLDELQKEFEHLRSIWFAVRGNHDVYERGWLGPLGLLLGKQRSIYGVAPLRRILFNHIDPPRVAASPVELRIGYIDLLSGRYRRAGNDHPCLVDAVLASCALPLIFPPIPLVNGQELGVDGGVRNIIPVLDVLTSLAELPPADGPDEIWILAPRLQLADRIPEPRLCHWRTAVRRVIAFVCDLVSVGEFEQTRQLYYLLRTAAGNERPHAISLHVLHPREPLSGSMLDFDPAKLRRWYEDGVRTARAWADSNV